MVLAGASARACARALLLFASFCERALAPDFYFATAAAARARAIARALARLAVGVHAAHVKIAFYDEQNAR